MGPLMWKQRTSHDSWPCGAVATVTCVHDARRRTSDEIFASLRPLSRTRQGARRKERPREGAVPDTVLRLRRIASKDRRLLLFVLFQAQTERAVEALQWNSSRDADLVNDRAPSARPHLRRPLGRHLQNAELAKISVKSFGSWRQKQFVATAAPQGMFYSAEQNT